MSNHAKSTANHHPFAATYADAAARTAATGFPRGEGGAIVAFDSTDVSKCVRQIDNNTVWMLTDDSPVTWVQIAGAGLTGAAHAASHQNGGSDEISVAGLSGLLAEPQTPATHTHSSSDVTDFGEAVEDKIGAKVVAGTGISVSYNDTTGETTITNTSPDSGSPPTTEQIQDIVGAMLTDNSDLDWTYDDGAATEVATLKGGASALNPAFTTLTDGATITWATGGARVNNAKVTLGGNRTLDITGEVDGASGILIVIQDGTGSRTLTLPGSSKVIDGGAGAITLTTAPGSIDILAWVYDGTNFYWTKGLNYT